MVITTTTIHFSITTSTIIINITNTNINIGTNVTHSIIINKCLAFEHIRRKNLSLPTIPITVIITAILTTTITTTTAMMVTSVVYYNFGHSVIAIAFITNVISYGAIVI